MKDFLLASSIQGRGVLEEFIFSPPLDNLCCSWLTTEALVKSLKNLEDDENVRGAL
jgi:aspartyl aminopeptidase